MPTWQSKQSAYSKGKKGNKVEKPISKDSKKIIVKGSKKTVSEKKRKLRYRDHWLEVEAELERKAAIEEAATIVTVLLP